MAMFPNLDLGRLSLAAGVLGGSNIGTGLSAGLQNAVPVWAAQKEEAKAKEIQNKTALALRGLSPELSQAVENGLLQPNEGYMMYLKQQKDAKDASIPKYDFKVVGDKLVRTEQNSGGFEQLADYSQPKLPAIAEEYNWAKQNGFDGSPQEYQIWKAGLTKQKGMVIESDGNGGFRMVQGDVETSKMPKLTEAEGKNAGFLLRARQAEELLTTIKDPKILGEDIPPALETEGTNERNRIANGVPVVGNYIRSDRGRQYQQAKDNFITAILRKESGAVISDSEYAREDAKYFPQPNDDATTVENKRRAREAAIEGLKLSSGPAADKIDGAQDNADPMGLR